MTKINPRYFPLFRSRMRPPIYNDSTLSVANTTGSGEKKKNNSKIPIINSDDTRNITKDGFRRANSLIL